MAEIIEMPKLSDTMEVGTIANWLKKEGDEVSIGDMLCEVETDKATMEMENLVTDGVLLKIYIENGGEAPIGSPICAIGEKGEKAPTVDALKPVSTKVPEAPVIELKARKKSQQQTEENPVIDIVVSEENTDRIKASPLAKKLAAEKGIPLNRIKGTGPRGRIVKNDVHAAEKAGASAPASTEPASYAAPSHFSLSMADEEIKLSNMRKTIAQRLVESKTQIPHFYLEIEVNAAPLLQTRSDLNKHLTELPPEKGGIKLTVNDFILKACAEALRRVPAVNASWAGDHIKQHGSINLSFGVAVPDGLVTPVIKDSQTRSLREISAEAKSLIAKARSKKLLPNEMAGSTFTVTNLGMYGITSFLGIINPPNAAILSVGATIKKPVVGPNDEIVVGHRMVLALSGDHRVVDGATAAEFLKSLKEILETPALMLL